MRDFSDELSDLARRVNDAHGYLRIADARVRLEELEADASRPDLWDDADAARRVTTELAQVRDDITLVEGLAEQVSDLETLAELAREEGDESLEPEIEDGAGRLRIELDKLELRALFTGEHDELDAICAIQSGAGGTDAQDWAQMLLRMFQRWAERQGFAVTIDDVSLGEEAGITSATFTVRGRYAYGMLTGERGVHRLVRISPFDSQARRQTAFASLDVVPSIEEGDAPEIDQGDLRIDTYRSSGAGGQHVNVTDSAVRITHLPTGLVTSCQNERSQHQNKDRAMAMLKAKLLDLEHQKRQAEIDAIRGETSAVDFGSQDRNYVLQPYQQVKDLRSGLELTNPDAVLDGDLDGLMEAFLRWQRAEGISA